MSNRTRLAAVAAGVVALLMVASAAPSTAGAATRFDTLRNVVRPIECNNSGHRISAGGWVANKRCGYVMGTAVAGTTFDSVQNTSDWFRFGRLNTPGGSFCTWIIPHALDSASARPATDTCSGATRDRIYHRRSIGRDFDCVAHSCDGGIVVKLPSLALCPGYYNYFVDSTYTRGVLRDPVNLPKKGGVWDTSARGYRYTSLDGKASMVRATRNDTGETIWFWVSRACINQDLVGKTLHNDND